MIRGNLVNRTVSQLYRCSQRFLIQKLKAYEMPLEVGQLPPLLQVYRYPGISQEGISSVTGLDKGTTARSVKQLELLGLIRRETDQIDRRVNHIYATEKALAIEETLWQIVYELHDILYHGLSEMKVYELIEGLEKAKRNIEQYLEGDEAK